MSAESKHLSLLARGDPATLRTQQTYWAEMARQREQDRAERVGTPLTDEEVCLILERPRDTLGRWITDDEAERLRLR